MMNKSDMARVEKMLGCGWKMSGGLFVEEESKVDVK